MHPSFRISFSIGDTITNCIASDRSNNQVTGSFLVTVLANTVDDIVPVLTLPADIQAEAMQPEGTQIFYSASSNDNIDGGIGINCLPNSGSVFAIGFTQVSCDSSDSSGNYVEGTFNISVLDTSAPDLNLPGNIFESTSTNGMEISFDASASDST